MKKYLKNRVVAITVLLMIFSIVNIIISYSFYNARVLNSETDATVSLKSAGITIIYENNTGDIVMDNILPGSAVTKQFTITSSTEDTSIQNAEVWYNIKLIIDDNTFSDNTIVYSLAVDSSSNNSGQTALEFSGRGIPSGSNKSGLSVGSGYLVLNGNASHVYNLEIKYPEEKELDANKNLKLHVVVEATSGVNVNIDLNGGAFSSGSATNFETGKNSVVYLETPILDNNEFLGWEIISGDGASLDGNMIVIGGGDVSIKANWNPLIPPAGTFATDDWETIAYYASHPENDSTPYNVGETREISLSGLTNGEANFNGKYTIRVANNSNYDCTLESKTACGLVVEFQDIIKNHRMNPSGEYNGTNYPYGYNLGGWPNSELYDYVKTDIYNALPSDLRAVIIDTEVISGHGWKDSNSNRTDGNWTSTDKIYLLSTTEVWGNCTGATNDTAVCADYAAQATITRQIDYYESKGVTKSSYSGAIKQLNGSNDFWWLRSAYSNYGITFSRVSSNGIHDNGYAYDEEGVAPAFRIG